jgi:hydroxyacylglutathione hydrolase
MHTITPGVHRLPALLPDAINAFLVEDVLVDAGARPSTRRILRALRGKQLSAHVLTHAHADHQGASHAVCTQHGVSLWCGAADVAAVESGDLTRGVPANSVTRLQQRVWAGPAHPVARALREGDDVAGFTVLETPGHAGPHRPVARARPGARRGRHHERDASAHDAPRRP